jgi:hypothetical protein
MHRRIRHLLIAAAAVFTAHAHADFYLVVQAGNPQRSLTQKEAVDLFMGRNRSFANGDFALVFDLPRDSAQRAAFYQALTGMSAAQVNSYWSRLMFSGQSMPPQPLPDEAAMIDIVKRNPSAIGWLSKDPADKQLRSVLVLKESP